MDCKAEILKYIKQKENSGALLLTGKWGCGKSYLLKEIAEELNKKEKYAVAVISLFGVDSIDALNRKVKEAYLISTSKMSASALKMSKAVSALLEDGADVAAAALPSSIAASAISKGISSVWLAICWSIPRRHRRSDGLTSTCILSTRRISRPAELRMTRFWNCWGCCASAA